MRNSPSLVTRDLTVYAGRNVVARNLNLDICAGTLVWIVGENGAGKSSLLRVLALRARANGKVLFDPAPSLADVAFYAPIMGVPPHSSVRSWLELNERLSNGKTPRLTSDDTFLPRVPERMRMTKLSTGEAKRFLLWSLLRTDRPFTFLDEPYDHLSPPARSRLTEILCARAARGVVVVATNQDVPPIANRLVVEIGQ